MSVLATALYLGPAALLYLGAGVVFDPARRTLVMIAGTNCQMSGFTVPSNVVMELR